MSGNGDRYDGGNNMSSKEEAFMSADPYYYEGATSSSDASSCYSSNWSYSSGQSNDDVSLLSTSTTYGSYGSWTGGDTHASGYEADCESNASSTK